MNTKKQHYVPRLMLRQFANEIRGEWRSQVYDMERKQSRRNQNIKDVLAENYTYDTDNSVENFLEKHVESPVGAEIERLLESPEQVSTTPTDNILRFLLVQIARTRQAYNGSIQFLDKFMETFFETFATLNGQSPEAARELRIRPSEPRQLLSYMAAYAARRYRLLSDLRVAIVVNDTPQEFLLADHPVFQHNLYLRDCNEPLSASLTVRGMQVFCPLSPRITYCLYDSAVYAYHEERPSPIVRANLSDVRALNMLQAINAGSFLVAKSLHMVSEMQCLGERFANVSAFTVQGYAGAPAEGIDGKIRSQHYAKRKPIRLDALPSFIKVKNKVRRRGVVCEHRRPDIVAEQELADVRLRERSR
ncbi:DUF4238 domain-containing protein [Achromobacter xylosoxidans]